MKKLALSVAALALTAGGALAADLPSRKGPPVLPPPPPPPPPMWTGFYAGLNAGYNFGTNSRVQSLAIGQDAVEFAGINIEGIPGDGFIATNNSVAFPTGAGLAQSGSFANTQDGFIGGGQVGYNYQWGSNFVVGIEADIQGTGIRGTSHGYGAGGGSAVSPGLTCTGGGFWNAFCNAVAPGVAPTFSAADSIGATTVRSGVDWLGTVRGRLGYLWTPTMLLYATGGLTYGGVYANVNQWANTTISPGVGPAGGLGFHPPIATNQTYVGGGNKSETLVGWNVGGGIEWMFMPNWSVKAEGIYWNMGNMSVPTASFAAAPLVGINPTTAFNSSMTLGAVRVNYQGVIARAGINYHFNWGGAAPVVAKY